MARPLAVGLCVTLALACSGPPPAPPVDPAKDGGVVVATPPPPVYFVAFTHIEDNLPSGMPGSAMARASYVQWRGNLLEMARLALARGVPWVLQPDWKFLEAAKQFEDATLTASTGGKNLFRYLVEDLRVVVDPHSHEAGGYNYADVASLLSQLGVGGSTVVGGHVWDPTLAQFAHWERFRAPLAGLRYPTFSWQAEILMGAATPGHVNDPEISGVWRPKDPDHFFEDDPAGALVAVGGYAHALTVQDLQPLHARYADGGVATSCMLTAAIHIQPADIATATARTAVENDVLVPLTQLSDAGVVALTDYTRLVEAWRSVFGARACIVSR